MAFCKQCGADLQGANFCPICGTSAAGNAAPQQLDPRQQTLIEMNRMQEYFGAKEDLYTQYDAVEAEVAERTQRGFGGWIGAAVICLLIGLFTQAVFFYIAIVPFVAAFVLLKKKNKEKLAQATVLLETLGEEKQKLYNDYGYCPIGLEYTHPNVLPLLCKYVSDGVANTASEALKHHADELARREAAKQAEALIKKQDEMNRELKKQRKIAVANFLLKK